MTPIEKRARAVSQQTGIPEERILRVWRKAARDMHDFCTGPLDDEAFCEFRETETGKAFGDALRALCEKDRAQAERQD